MIKKEMRDKKLMKTRNKMMIKKGRRDKKERDKKLAKMINKTVIESKR